MDYFIEAIESLRPGAGFVLRGESVDGIEWITRGVPPLTQSEVEAEASRIVEAAAQRRVSEELARQAAISHAKSLGFTDEMIAVMYPNLALAY